MIMKVRLDLEEEAMFCNGDSSKCARTPPSLEQESLHGVVVLVGYTESHQLLISAHVS